MSEQTIENHINEILPVNAQKLALDFVIYLRAQEMQFERGTGYWEDKRYWMIMNHKGTIKDMLEGKFKGFRLGETKLHT